MVRNYAEDAKNLAGGSRKMKRLVVGFDPGETVGLAIVDLEKKAVLLKSMRQAGLDKVVEEARSFGKPILVASDVAPVPESVKKFAAAFGAEVSCPEVSMSVEEKKTLAGGFGYGDAHQRDALAAALRAHSEVLPLIERAKKKGPQYEEIVEDFLKGRFHTVKTVEKKEKKFVLPIEIKLKILSQSLKNKNHLLSLQRDEMERLKANASVAETPSKPVRESIRYQALRKKMKGLVSRLEHLERTLGRINGEVVVLHPSLKGDVVFVPLFDEKAAKEVDAKIVITSKKLVGGTGVYTLAELDGTEVEGIAFIPTAKFPKPGKEWLVKLVGAYKKERTF